MKASSSHRGSVSSRDTKTTFKRSALQGTSEMFRATRPLLNPGDPVGRLFTVSSSFRCAGARRFAALVFHECRSGKFACLNSRSEVLSEKAFLVHQKELGQTFVVRHLDPRERKHYVDWMKLAPHCNVATAYEIIEHEDEAFLVQEHVASGLRRENIYDHIHTLRLSLDTKVPRRYIRFLFQFMIQMVNCLSFVHKQNITHGRLKLSNILMESLTSKNHIFKVKNFRNSRRVSKKQEKKSEQEMLE